MDLEEFNDFVNFLIQTCELLVDAESTLTTKIVQETFLQIHQKREKQREWKKSKSTTKSEKSTETFEESTSKTEESTVDFEQRKLKESKGNKKKVNNTVFAPAEPSRTILKNDDPEPFWDLLVKTWFDFIEENFNERPSFTGADPKHFKIIIQKLRKRSEDKSISWSEISAPKRLRNFLTMAFTDEWLKKNFLLKNLNDQYDKIIQNHSLKEKQFQPPKPQIDRAAIEINNLYELFKEDKCSTISIEITHFTYLKKACRLELSNHETEKLRTTATEDLQKKNIKPIGDTLSNHMKKLAVIDYFQKLKKLGTPQVFDIESVTHE
jgi:hypothetical protein